MRAVGGLAVGAQYDPLTGRQLFRWSHAILNFCLLEQLRADMCVVRAPPRAGAPPCGLRMRERASHRAQRRTSPGLRVPHARRSGFMPNDVLSLSVTIAPLQSSALPKLPPPPPPPLRTPLLAAKRKIPLARTPPGDADADAAVMMSLAIPRTTPTTATALQVAAAAHTHPSDDFRVDCTAPRRA